jgi:hypothetical protein
VIPTSCRTLLKRQPEEKRSGSGTTTASGGRVDRSCWVALRPVAKSADHFGSLGPALRLDRQPDVQQVH